jgi:hypothetical protein
MSIKSKLLEEINKKAQKIRDKRIDAANNKSLEAAIFDFFRNIEESRKVHGGTMYDPNLFTQAKISLQERVRGFDYKAKISVDFNVSEDLKNWEEQTVRGVTIWWSNIYIAKNNCDPSLYTDISQMLFL